MLNESKTQSQVLSIFLALTLSFASSSSYARRNGSDSSTTTPRASGQKPVDGPKDSGGGKGIRCIENGRKKTYLADTFELVRSGALKDLAVSEPRAVIEAAAEAADRLMPGKNFPHPTKPGEKVSLGWLIEHKRSELDFQYASVDQLPDFPDDHISPESIPANCEKVQIAIQDLSRGIVSTDVNHLTSMTFAERGFFELHEVLIALRNSPGADTTPIRDQVNAMAETLNNPHLSFQTLIRSILFRKALRAETSQASSDYIYKHCQSTHLDPKPQPGDTEEVTRCRMASAEADASYRKDDREKALKTLLAVPQTLSCRITYSGNNYFNWPKPPAFDLVRVSGDGRPRSEGVYEIRFAQDGFANAKPDGTSVLRTRRHMRDAGFRDHGLSIFGASWDVGNGYKIKLHFRGYIGRTQEFEASLQLTQPGDRVDLRRHSDYGVVCDGSQTQFDIDLKGSEAG